jgi:hypothetical protein
MLGFNLTNYTKYKASSYIVVWMKMFKIYVSVKKFLVIVDGVLIDSWIYWTIRDRNNKLSLIHTSRNTIGLLSLLQFNGRPPCYWFPKYPLSSGHLITAAAHDDCTTVVLKPTDLPIHSSLTK